MILSESSPYYGLWNKYRPVILQLMSGSELGGIQQYQLFSHEFKAIGEKEKSGYTFLLEAQNGKALNNIKASRVAANLLQVLQQSKRASELMQTAKYAFSLDKHFMLHVEYKGAIEPVEALVKD